ncbi:MAG: hypothetical protein J6B85_04175 [Lachnospiraceae bacterium]|nr:hypothetical protein [Lachnospiraceae bacterium]
MYTKLDIRNKLAAIFEENGLDIENITMLKEMDSLQYVSILVSAEEEFGIEFPDTVLTQNILGEIDGLCELIGFFLGERYIEDVNA